MSAPQRRLETAPISTLLVAKVAQIGASAALTGRGVENQSPFGGRSFKIDNFHAILCYKIHLEGDEDRSTKYQEPPVSAKHFLMN